MFSKEGHAKVLNDYKSPDGYKLGGWVYIQRSQKSNMSLERRAMFEALPSWSWDVFYDKWEEGFRYLKEFADREGHAKVPQSYITIDKYRLGAWVAKQRRTKDVLTLERKERLEALPGWSWDALSDKWEKGFSYIQEYTVREGRAEVPRDYKFLDGYSLGNWVKVQRREKDNMPPERKMRLEELPGWSWDPFTDKWDDGYRHLLEFVDIEGHARVTKGQVSGDGYGLGNWIAVQRGIKESMAPERKARLEALPGWSWDVYADRWEEGYQYLKTFADREGHAKPIKDFRTSEDYALGQWVDGQRSKRSRLTQERIDQLEALPGWSWSPFSDKWEEGFQYLKKYIEMEGNTRIPGNHKTEDGYRLGSWVATQRINRDNMPIERRVRLDALLGWLSHS